MVDWLVTANLGGTFATEAVKASGTAWAKATIETRPAIVFVQEIPSQAWLELWRTAGYRVTVSDAREWKVRSALLTRHDLTIRQLSARDLPTLTYFESYVAAAALTSKQGEVILASVHASPNPAEPATYGWSGQLPEPRNGGGHPDIVAGELWDSDLLLTTLSHMAARSPVVAGGDFNEARGFDFDEKGARLGTWGQEYFDRVTAHQLTAWPSAAWGEERPTRGRLQVDHILVSAAAEELLLRDPEPHLDPAWASTSTSDRPEHTPIWVALDSSRL